MDVENDGSGVTEVVEVPARSAAPAGFSKECEDRKEERRGGGTPSRESGIAEENTWRAGGHAGVRMGDDGDGVIVLVVVVGVGVVVVE